MHALPFALLSTLALLVCSLGSACGTDALVEQESAALEALAASSRQEGFVRNFSLEAPARAVRWAENRSTGPSLRDVLQDPGFALEADEDWRALVLALYEARDWQPIFVRNAQLTRDGLFASDQIRGALRTHAINTSDWHLDAIEERLSVLGTYEERDRLQRSLELNEDETRTLRDWLTAATPEELASRALLSRRLLADPGSSPLQRWTEAAHQLADKIQNVAVAGPELEFWLATNWLRLAREMRLGNLRYVSRSDADARGWDLQDESQHDRYIAELLSEHFLRAADEGFEALWPTLQPGGEQYALLVEGFRTYLGYVEAGGWEPLPDGPILRSGARGPEVRALRARLAAEEYYRGELDNDRFDSTLERALRNYQTTHQLDVSGTLDSATRSSLDVPATRRLAQIAVSLQRWRETSIGADFDRDHIRVSIPDFHAELWDGDELVHRWRVVVGSTRRARSPRGQLELADATPTFFRNLRFVVFNPYWNIPPGIRAREYDPRIEANPNFFEENDYELVRGDDGYEWIRQLPGPSNALGQVKFLFPNPYHVYFHDTPHKHLFRHTLRAYSAGCIRVQDPLDLARILIQRDRGWTDARTRDFIQEQLALPDEQWFTLRQTVPVHIEYFVVRGDENGRMNFLADIYRHDRPLLDEAEAWLPITPQGTTPDEPEFNIDRVGIGP